MRRRYTGHGLRSSSTRSVACVNSHPAPSTTDISTSKPKGRWQRRFRPTNGPFAVQSIGIILSGYRRGLAIRAAVALRADRVPPVDNDAAYEAWTKDRLYASQVEQVAERWVAQAGFLVMAPLCAVLAVLAHWLGN